MKKSILHEPLTLNQIRTLIAFVLVVGLAGVGLFVFQHRQSVAMKYADLTRPAPPPISEPVSAPAPKEDTKVQVAAAQPKAEEIPETFNLAVPFTTQAPFANWDEIHDETCEEASVLMVRMYYKKLKLTPKEVDDELLKLVDIQEKLFGFYKDTTVSETIKFAQKAYSYKGKIIDKPTIETIKKLVMAGRPVLVPAAGRELHNPNFRGSGPPYHIYVIRGWNQQGFFVNDPGTRKGENFFYSYATVMDSMHDWDHEKSSATGPARIFILTP